MYGNPYSRHSMPRHQTQQQAPEMPKPMEAPNAPHGNMGGPQPQRQPPQPLRQ